MRRWVVLVLLILAFQLSIPFSFVSADTNKTRYSARDTKQEKETKGDTSEIIGGVLGYSIMGIVLIALVKAKPLGNKEKVDTDSISSEYKASNTSGFQSKDSYRSENGIPVKVSFSPRDTADAMEQIIEQTGGEPDLVIRAAVLILADFEHQVLYSKNYSIANARTQIEKCHGILALADEVKTRYGNLISGDAWFVLQDVIECTKEDLCQWETIRDEELAERVEKKINEFMELLDSDEPTDSPKAIRRYPTFEKNYREYCSLIKNLGNDNSFEGEYISYEEDGEKATKLPFEQYIQARMEFHKHNRSSRSKVQESL